jgi:hypothetical protein
VSSWIKKEGKGTGSRVGKGETESRKNEAKTKIIITGRAYAFEEFSALLNWVRKPYTVELKNCDVILTEAEWRSYHAQGICGKGNWRHVGQKKEIKWQWHSTTNQQMKMAQQSLQYNKSCHHWRCHVRHMPARHSRNRCIQEKQISSLNAEKKCNEILLTLVEKRKEQCDEAKKLWLQQQSTQPLPPLPLLGGGAIERVAEPREMIVEEYYQVFENSVKYVMDILLRLFVPESKRYSQRTNQSSQWCIIKNEKALPATKAHFDSKAEAAIQRSIQGEDQLAELQNEDAPAGVLQDTDNDTSDGENQIETTWID